MANSFPDPQDSLTIVNSSNYSLSPTQTRDGDSGFLLDDTTDFILQLVTIVIAGVIVGLFGTVANVINIFVFIKQGLFSGGSVLSLFFLAMADLGVTLTYFLHGIGIGVMVSRIPDLPIEPFSIVYLAIGCPHAMFIKINRMLTAYVAFERCMCVVIPFRVKNIFAPQRSLIYLLAIFAYGLFSHMPVYLTDRLGEVKREGSNTTIISLVFTRDREFWHDLVYYGNFLVLSLTTVAIVIVCTMVTGAYVRTSKEWRKKVSSIATEDQSSIKNTNSSNHGDYNNAAIKNKTTAVDKETRLVKMIICISAIFCVSYIPDVTLIIVSSVDHRINTAGQYSRLSHIMYGLTFLSATVNSSVNVFMYYRMSSKFRQIFRYYFCGEKDKA